MYFFYKHRYIFYTFLIAFAVMTLAFAKEGLYPFGGNQIMIIDAWHQYYPILQELHHKLQNFDSLFYTWNSGMGTNFLVMMGYYAMSPLNLLSIFVPAEFLREFMLFATITKISLAGATFAIYLRALFKRDDLSLVIFGLFFAFSGYLMGYYWDIMWLDAVVLLPLVTLGMHQLMASGKWRLFSATLALTLISNFYTAYFVCLWVAFYFFVLFTQNSFGKSFKDFVAQLVRFAGASLLGIGLAAITLLPIVYGMSRAYGLKSGNPTTLTTYHALMDIFNNLLANIKPTVIDGLPNIQSGILPLMFAILYFSVTAIPLRNRIANGIMLAFLFLSMNLNLLNFAWHGFHFPNQVPFRFSFLVSFLLITLAYEAFSNLKILEERKVQGTLFVMMAYLLVCERLYKDTFDFKVFYISILFFALYTGIVTAWMHKKITTGLLMVLLLTVGMSEYGLNAFKATHVAGNSGRSDYPTQNVAVQTALKDLKKLDSSFYRVEMYPNYSANDPILYQYPGISQFSSTANASINYYLKDFGVSADPGSNSVMYLPTPPAVTGMLNIKYALSKHDGIPLPNAGYTEIGKYDGLTLLKSNYPMPAGIVADAEIQSFDIGNINPFVVQTDYLTKAAGTMETLFIPVQPAIETYDNIERSQLEQNLRFHYRNINASAIGKANITFKATEAGQYYAYMLNGSKTVSMTVKGKNTQYETPRGVLMDLGVLNAAEDIRFEFELPAQATGFFDIAVVRLDVAAYERLYNRLVENRFDVSQFTSNRLEGTVTSTKPGQLLLSVPFDPGWQIKLNGNPVIPAALKDGIMAIPVAQGTHSLTMSFVPKGFYAGLALTLISIAAFVFMPILTRRLKPPSTKVQGPKPQADPA